MHRLRDIRLKVYILWPWNWGSGLLKVIESSTIRYSTYDFMFVFHSNYVSIYYRFQDIAAYWSKITTPLYSAPPLGLKPSDLRNDPWWRKTRMMGLSDGERISAVLTQSTRVTDGRTDGHIRAIALAYMLSRVKNKEQYSCLTLLLQKNPSE